jgi:hypothetical protein
VTGEDDIAWFDSRRFNQTPQDIVLQGIRPHRTSACQKMYTTLPLLCGVWYPARLSSAGSDTQQGLVLRGLIPPRILFCRVSDPADKLRPCRTRRKSFESLPFSLKGHFLKIVCMYKLHFPRHIGFMLKEPYLKFFLCSPGSDTPQNNFEIRISPRSLTRIWKCFRAWIRGPYGVDSWKNQGPEILCYCTFKGTVAQDFWPLVFFMNRPHMGLWFIPLNNFEFWFKISEIF